MNYETAIASALKIQTVLEPACLRDHCIIAGSIRRQKRDDIKDVEIVCLPLTYRPEIGLFSEPGAETVAPAWIKAIDLISTGAGETKGKPDGRYCKRWWYGVAVDIFMPQPHDFWRQVCIRTGSAEWVQKHIARGWVGKGWVGTKEGLRWRSQCEDTASGWKCIALDPVLPPHWQSETEFMDWLGLGYIEPQNRNL